MADELIYHVQAKLDPELVQWFHDNCPAFSKQEFIVQCFEMLRAAVVSGAIPHPNVFPARAAIDAAGILSKTNTIVGGSRG